MKLLFILFFINVVMGAPPNKGNNVPDFESVTECCLNKPKRTEGSLEELNYDCSQLEPFGMERCNWVHYGKVCTWGKGKQCKIPEFTKCVRVKKYETHFNKIVDVGRCIGGCKGDKTCTPDNYDNLNLGTADVPMNVRIIKDCNCDDCGVIEKNRLIEIPEGSCHGKCNNNQQNLVCVAGVDDSFSVSNGPEGSSPSTLLLSGILSQCSAGVQSGFDVFLDNRCFGHTFIKCFKKGPCNLRSATLHICMRAANVPLTNTDSLILGTNGNSIWGRSLPNLNGGSWNPGDTLCTDIDLDNLPGGGSVLANIDASNHLDVVVQDDSAVDYIKLGLEYEECVRCLPTSSVVSTIYTENGLTHYENIKDCDCILMGKCHRESNLKTYYPGTKYEVTLDVGQCLGDCNTGSVCVADETVGKKIKAPEGVRLVNVIKSCNC